MAAREKQDDLKTETQAHTADVAVPADAASMDALEFVPDGGREAWTVVLGSTLALFASAGMINAYVSLSSLVPCCVLTTIYAYAGRVSGLLRVDTATLFLSCVDIAHRVTANIFPIRLRPAHRANL